MEESIVDIYNFSQEVIRDSSFMVTLAIALLALSALLLFVVFKFKNRKTTKVFLYACIGVIVLLQFILILMFMGVLPSADEFIAYSDCCQYIDAAPSLATRLIVVLPFISIVLGVASLISRKVATKTKKRTL